MKKTLYRKSDGQILAHVSGDDLAHYVTEETGLLDGWVEFVPEVSEAFRMNAYRAERNERLNASAWTVMPDSPLVNKLAWAEYRQALHQMTVLYPDPDDAVWPEKPEYVYAVA